MIELVLGTYGFLCWLVFKKWKLIPVNTYTVVTAILIGVVFLGVLGLLLLMFHPASKDARLYAFTTPILPQVKGVVIDVPVQPNQPLKKGDVLFHIDPTPYQYEVDRLEATLADANKNVAQLEERHAAAKAATEQARANLESSESEFDRQAREALEEERAAVAAARSQLDLARKEYQRYADLVEKGTISREKYDLAKQRVDGAQAQLRQVQAAERRASEKLQAGGAGMQSATEQVRQAEAQEREARHALEAQSGGVNPQVRQVMAELDTKRWELDQTTVRAPADGYVTQLLLRPGQMAVPFPVAPVMVFVHDENAALVASFPQNVIPKFRPGLEAELAFKAYPGRIFKARVNRILPIIPEGQLAPTGQLRSVTPAVAPGRIPVVFDYGEDVEDLHLPGGAQATVAVYGDRLHALSIMRKILVRIKSWENYVFLP